MKIFGIIVASILGLMLLTAIGWGVRIAMLPGRAIDRTISTGEGIIDQTLTADNAIYNYEWFKQQYEDIDASKKKLANAQDSYSAFKASLPASRTKWSFEDKQEDARLNSVVLGLQNYLEQLVADYNARAKMANRNIFQDGVIPSFIEIGSNFLK